MLPSRQSRYPGSWDGSHRDSSAPVELANLPCNKVSSRPYRTKAPGGGSWVRGDDGTHKVARRVPALRGARLGCRHGRLAMRSGARCWGAPRARRVGWRRRNGGRLLVGSGHSVSIGGSVYVVTGPVRIGVGRVRGNALCGEGAIGCLGCATSGGRVAGRERRMTKSSRWRADRRCGCWMGGRSWGGSNYCSKRRGKQLAMGTWRSLGPRLAKNRAVGLVWPGPEPATGPKHKASAEGIKVGAGAEGSRAGHRRMLGAAAWDASMASSGAVFPVLPAMESRCGWFCEDTSNDFLAARGNKVEIREGGRDFAREGGGAGAVSRCGWGNSSAGAACDVVEGIGQWEAQASALSRGDALPGPEARHNRRRQLPQRSVPLRDRRYLPAHQTPTQDEVPASAARNVPSHSRSPGHVHQLHQHPYSLSTSTKGLSVNLFRAHTLISFHIEGARKRKNVFFFP